MPVPDCWQQARCLFHKKLLDCGTGKMPVPDCWPQARCLLHLDFVEQASCLFQIGRGLCDRI
ncbi:hypothetical protein QUA00_17475 [Microcoleus sp. T2B6]|uniref:hypothetical protein n=1 Tax=Microcoleus sp. T2B6 TaxID=3055424 RepID=UPI002FCED083